MVPIIKAIKTYLGKSWDKKMLFRFSRFYELFSNGLTPSGAVKGLTHSGSKYPQEHLSLSTYPSLCHNSRYNEAVDLAGLPGKPFALILAVYHNLSPQCHHRLCNTSNYLSSFSTGESIWQWWTK